MFNTAERRTINNQEHTTILNHRCPFIDVFTGGQPFARDSVDAIQMAFVRHQGEVAQTMRLLWDRPVSY